VSVEYVTDVVVFVPLFQFKVDM